MLQPLPQNDVEHLSGGPVEAHNPRSTREALVAARLTQARDRDPTWFERELHQQRQLAI